MRRDNQHNPDPNANAARIVAESTRFAAQEAPLDLEAAWLAWSGHIQNVDERTLTLLRAAFESWLRLRSILEIVDIPVFGVVKQTGRLRVLRGDLIKLPLESLVVVVQLHEADDNAKVHQ